MTKTLVLLIGLALTGVAQAQVKCWTGTDGRRACGDAPPPGVMARTIGSAAAATDVVPGVAAKDAQKGPLTSAEREQEYRKRQAEGKKLAAKAEQEKKDGDARREHCDRSRETLVSLELGQRILRTDAKGERYFLDDAQREQEAARARQSVQQSCS